MIIIVIMSWGFYGDHGDHVMEVLLNTYLNDICLEVRLHLLSKCFTKA